MTIYGIYFNCRCGTPHFAFARVQFMNAPHKDVSVAKFYANRELPDDLKSFLAKPFVCPINHDVTTLPDLDEFFFELEGGSYHVA